MASKDKDRLLRTLPLRRVFKFRAKRLFNGEPTDKWAYGNVTLDYGGIDMSSLFRHSDDPELYSVGLRAAAIYDPRDHGTCAVNAGTLGQWTGLKDSRSVEIYEDDIVNDGKYTGVVTWFPKRACFQLKCGSVNVYLHDNKGTVIGNIHDHPELINQQK